MDNLADISLDLICALKFPPADGYEIEDIQAIENACWQTLAHGLDGDEWAAVVRAANRQIEELELEENGELPDYLQKKLVALRQLVKQDPACA